VRRLQRRSLALASCLAGFHAHLPLAMEAALVVGLTAAGPQTGPAVAGVLTFRLLTFWLPILPGCLAYRSLRAGDTPEEMIAAAERGLQRIRVTLHLPFSFLRHCGRSLG
jgi:hypothetical protein